MSATTGANRGRELRALVLGQRARAQVVLGQHHGPDAASRAPCTPARRGRLRPRGDERHHQTGVAGPQPPSMPVPRAGHASTPSGSNAARTRSASGDHSRSTGSATNARPAPGRASRHSCHVERHAAAGPLLQRRAPRPTPTASAARARARRDLARDRRLAALEEQRDAAGRQQVDGARRRAASAAARSRARAGRRSRRRRSPRPPAACAAAARRARSAPSRPREPEKSLPRS